MSMAVEVRTWMAAALLLAACSGGSEGTLSLPPADGGITVSEAAARAGATVWVRGHIVAIDGAQVRLCEALAESFPPQCGGASIALGDGVIWREPGEQTAVIGSVVDGRVTDGVDADPPDAPAWCGFDPEGPCAAYPGVGAANGVWWTDVAYSVLGSVDDGRLTAPRAPGGGDL